MDLRHFAQRSFAAAGLSATCSRRVTLYDSSLVDLVAPAGLRLSTRIDPGGAFITADPGLEVAGAGLLPDVGLESIAYRFGESEFDIETRAGIISSILDPLVEAYLNAQLRPRLPAALRSRGYRPTTDPQLADTVGELRALLDFPTKTNTSGPDLLNQLVELRGYVQIKASESIAIPVPGLADMEAVIPAGAILFVEVETTGKATSPSLRFLASRAQSDGVLIRSTGNSALAGLTTIEITRLTVFPGPLLSFQYRLLLEQLADSAVWLAKFVDLLAGRYGPDDVPEVRFRSMRLYIDRLLTDAMTELLVGLMADYDRLIPGISLSEVIRGAP